MRKYKEAWTAAPFFMFALHGGAIFETFNLFHLAYSFLYPRFEAVSLDDQTRVTVSALLSLVGASIIVSMIVGTGINNLKGASFLWTLFAVIVSYVSYNMLPDKTEHITDLLTMSIKTNSIGKFMFAFLLPYSVYFSTHQVAKRTTKTDFESKEIALEERKRLNAIREQELEQEKYEQALKNKAHQEQLKALKRYIIPEQTQTVNPETIKSDPYQEVFEKFGINGTPLPHKNGNGKYQNASVPKNDIGFKFQNASVPIDTEIEVINEENPQNASVLSVLKEVHVGEEIGCEVCDGRFIKKRIDHRFCSDACRLKAHKEKGGNHGS